MMKVLVVDDDSSARDVLVYSLKRLGFSEFEQAESGHEALKKFVPGEFALVVSDVEMPGMDGFSLAQSIFEQDPEQPLLLLSSELKHADRAQKFSIHFLAKGYGPEELFRAVDACSRS